MAETLFGEAVQAQEGAGQSINAAATRKQEAGTAPVQGTDQGLQALHEKLDRAENMIDITPQLATGLMRNTGDRSWMQAIGTKMRADVYTALYTHGINTKITGKEYKTINDGKEYTITNTIGDDGELTPRIVAIGDASVNKTGADTAKAEADRKSREKIAADKATRTDPKQLAAGLLQKIGQSKDETAKKTLIANYNKVASENGYEPYQEDKSWWQRASEFFGGGSSQAAPAEKPASAPASSEDDPMGIM